MSGIELRDLANKVKDLAQMYGYFFRNSNVCEVVFAPGNLDNSNALENGARLAYEIRKSVIGISAKQSGYEVRVF